MPEQTVTAVAAAALRAHRSSDGPETDRLLSELAALPAAEVSKAWLLVAKRAYDALPPDMADDMLANAGDVMNLASFKELEREAWDRATTFLSHAVQGFVDPSSIGLVLQRNPYLPQALLRAMLTFAAELPPDVASDALDAVITNDGKL